MNDSPSEQPVIRPSKEIDVIRAWMQTQWERIPATPHSQPGSYARGYDGGMVDILRGLQATLDKLPPAHETGALPSLEELLANLPPDADERLANAINTSERLEALSNQALVDIALGGCFEGSPTSTLVLHEMCSRLHPGWENEIPEEDAHAPKANEHPPGDCNRKGLPGDTCDRNCNWPECGCVCGHDGVMRPALSE